MPEMTIEQAIQSALELNQSVGKAGVGFAYTELEKAVQLFENEGYPLESIIPQENDAGLGFSLRRADGRTFVEIYSGLIRKKLCDDDGEFNKLIKSGVNASTGAILTAIVTSLGIPLVALGVLIPITVIIANTGLEAFCEFTEEDN